VVTGPAVRILVLSLGEMNLASQLMCQHLGAITGLDGGDSDNGFPFSCFCCIIIIIIIVANGETATDKQTHILMSPGRQRHLYKPTHVSDESRRVEDTHIFGTVQRKMNVWRDRESYVSLIKKRPDPLLRSLPSQ